MAESQDLSYSIIDDDGNKVETTYKEYDFPFYRYSKTCTVNTGTGKKNVEKKVVKKNFNEIVEDVIIVSTASMAVNLVTNGISHFINSLKRDRRKKK